MTQQQQPHRPEWPQEWERLIAAAERALYQQPRCLRDQVGASKRDDCHCVSHALREALAPFQQNKEEVTQ